MKKFLVPLLVLLLWLVTTTTALALPQCLKDPAFCRTGVITTVACENGDCCNSCCQHATATYIGTTNGHDGLWLTSSHAVGGAKTIWIDGYVADYVAGADIKPSPATCGGCAGEIGWAALRTQGYIPCGACPAQPDFGVSCCGRELFFVDVTKCGTVTKCHVTDCCGTTGTVFLTDTLPDCPNCGAVAYDYCGRMVGVLVSGGKCCQPGKCCKKRYTAFIPLTANMFQCLEPEQPADATAPAPGA